MTRRGTRPAAAGAVPLDVRLAIAAALAWATLAACLARSPATVAGAAAAMLAVGVAATALAGRAGRGGAGRGGAGAGPPRRHRPAAAVALAAFGAALVLVPAAARIWQARTSPLAALAREHATVTAQLRLTGDPRPLAARGIAGSPRVAVPVALDGVVAHGRPRTLSGRALVIAPAAGWAGLLPGQRARAEGVVQPALDRGLVIATIFTQRAPQLLTGPPWWQRAAGTVRSSLHRAAAPLPPGARGLLPGLVDGDTSALDPVLADRFREAGLTHLVAVSGTNCSILVGTVLLGLRRVGTRPALRALAGAAVLVAFVAVARPSPSVLRAALMATIALAALASGRPRSAVPALAAAVLLALLWDPQLAVDAGFAMSVLATAALLLLAPRWAAGLRGRGVPVGVAEAIAVAAAAHVVTAPVVAAISGRVSVVAIPANVLAEPAVALATILGFAAAAVAPLWLPGGQALAWLAGWPCRWLVLVADRAGGLPGASLAWPGGAGGALVLLVLTITGYAAVRRPGVWRVLAVGALLGAALQIPVRTVAPGWPPHGWLLVACDVGQGDALALAAGPGRAVVVDAGPDPLPVDRCLRDLHVREVPLMAITHFHLDHVGGLAGVLHDRRVGRVVSGPLAEPEAGILHARAVLAPRGLWPTVPPVGRSLHVGPLGIDVLGPRAAFHDTRSDPNNSSLVLRAHLGGVLVLLAGDTEVEAQDALLSAGTDLRADVLKVPHHGSAYVDARFLAAVRARVGVISVGLDNDYGHPSPVLLRQLQVLGTAVRRTDLEGDVAVVGPRAALTTVVRTKAAPAAPAAAPAASAPAPNAAVAGQPHRAPSAAGARMVTWRHRVQSVPSPSRTCPTRCRRSCSWSATRSCSSPAASARSPPRSAGATPG